MVDYGTVDEILETTDNMTFIRNNSLNDDGTDVVDGVDWFQYNGKAASKLYVSGNSWIGIGENSEQLKIVRRDADLMTLRREEEPLGDLSVFAGALGGLLGAWQPHRCHSVGLGCGFLRYRGALRSV